MSKAGGANAPRGLKPALLSRVMMRFLVIFASVLILSAAEKPSAPPAQESGPQGIELPIKLDDKGGPTFPRFGTKDYFNYVFRTPMPDVQLAGPVRLADYVVDGKFELSLRSYTELVMANNTDIQIQKLLVEPQRNAITRSFAIFDPLVRANFNATRNIRPVTNLNEGAPAQIVGTLNQPAGITYQQLLPTGTQITGGYNYLRNTTNSTRATINPSYDSSVNVQFLQPLLRNRGSYVNKLPVLLARTRLKAGEFNVEDQVIRLLTTAENAYWDVIGARENLKVQEQSLALADAALKRAQRELELGAISALEIFQPRAQYARAEIFVTQARYRLQQAEDALRRQIGIDLDPDLRKLPIVLTEPVETTDNKTFDREALVAEALRNRPDIRSFATNIDVDDYNLKIAANNLKPDFGLTGTYTSQGIGLFFPPNNVSPVQGGFGDAWSSMWGFNYPAYGFGFQLRLPLKDRNAAANYADAAVQKRSDALTLRRAEQTARLEVLNAISQVENSRASVDLAKIAANLAQQRVEADQKRYDLGTITLFFLLSSQTDLTQAQSDLVNNAVQYRRNQLNLLLRTGTLLQERGIVVR